MLASRKQILKQGLTGVPLSVQRNEVELPATASEQHSNTGTEDLNFILFERHPVPACLISADGLIEFINQQFKLQISSDNVKNITDLFVDKLRAARAFNLIQTNSFLEKFKLTLITPKLSVEHFELSAQKIKISDSDYYICSFNNINHTISTYNKVQDRNKRLQIINSLSASISSRLELKKLIQLLTESLAQISGAENSACYTGIKDNKNYLKLYSDFNNYSNIKNENIWPETLDLELFQGKNIFQILNPEQSKNFFKSESLPESTLVVPITSRNNEMLGMVILTHSKSKVFDQETSVMLQEVCDLASISFENAQLFEAKKEEEARFRSLIECIPQLVWTSNPDGTVDYLNKDKSTSILNRNKLFSELGLRKYLSREDFRKAISEWKDCIDKGRSFEMELKFKNENANNHIWHLVRAVPLKNPNGEIIKWLGTCTDINEHKLLEQKKDAFISIASHELKTPLTSIKAYAELLDILLKKENTDPSLSTYVLKMKHQIDRLGFLISELLDVSNLQKGKISQKLTDFSFDDLVKETIDVAQESCESHTILITGSADTVFRGDRLRLSQVLLSYISNAVKYSPVNSNIKVEVESSSKEILLKIKDEGIGIAMEDLEKIFDRFYRVENNCAIYSGLGMGLYISSEIIKKHQGKTWVESSIGQGSTFYIQLPKNNSIINNQLKIPQL